jgi:hypothetical protein
MGKRDFLSGGKGVECLGAEEEYEPRAKAGHKTGRRHLTPLGNDLV